MRDRAEDGAEDDLEALFAQARALRAEPSEALMARVLADAWAESEARRAPAPAPSASSPARSSPWRDLAAALGGWPALGGLAGVAVAGVWIGAANPALVPGGAATEVAEEVSVGFGADEDPLGLLGT